MNELKLTIRLGLQSALPKPGHIPTCYRTDNSTAATHNFGAKAREKSLQERGGRTVLNVVWFSAANTLADLFLIKRVNLLLSKRAQTC